MKCVTRTELCLSLGLLMTLICNSPAQEPRTQGSPDKRKVKLPALLSVKPLKADPKDDELRKLLKARYNEAVSEARSHYEMEQIGTDFVTSEDHRYQMLQRVVQAGLELCDTPAEKVALLTHYLDVVMEAEKLAQAKCDVGRIFIGDLHRARYERLDAEIRLLRVKREADKLKQR